MTDEKEKERKTTLIKVVERQALYNIARALESGAAGSPDIAAISRLLSGDRIEAMVHAIRAAAGQLRDHQDPASTRLKFDDAERAANDILANAQQLVAAFDLIKRVAREPK